MGFLSQVGPAELHQFLDRMKVGLFGVFIPSDEGGDCREVPQFFNGTRNEIVGAGVICVVDVPVGVPVDVDDVIRGRVAELAK